MVAQLDPLKPALGMLLLAIAFGLGAAWLRARGQARWLLAIDTVLIFPALIPAPAIAGAILPCFAGATDPKWAAMLAAMAVVSAPLAYLPARLALMRVDREYRNTSRVLGLGAVGRALRIDLPLAWPALVLGAVIASARLLGEFTAAVGAIDRFTVLTSILFSSAILGGVLIAREIARRPSPTR